MKIWKNQESCKLVFSCEAGNATVDFHADLGQPDGLHLHHEDPLPSPLRRKKTPAQIRRSERRRKEFLDKKREEAEIASTETNEHAKLSEIAAEVVDEFCSEETYSEVNEKDANTNEAVITIEGEFHSRGFPQNNFKEYLNENLCDTIEETLKVGYWYEDNFTGFFATMKLKAEVEIEQILDNSNWPKVIKNLKISQDYGPK